MAEFCLDCLNRLEGTCYTKWDVSDGNISVYMMIITANHANKPILTVPLKPL